MVSRWLPVAGYEGLYAVSDKGQVRSLDRVVRTRDGRVRRCHGKLLAQSTIAKGYRTVTLSRDGLRDSFAVHRLVGEAFLGPLPPDMETRHGPGGHGDNSVDNLSYGSAAENEADKRRDGTHREGSAIPWAKLSDALVRECRARYRSGGVTVADLAAEFGVAMQTMHEAITGKTWRHVAIAS